MREFSVLSLYLLVSHVESQWNLGNLANLGNQFGFDLGSVLGGRPQQQQQQQQGQGLLGGLLGGRGQGGGALGGLLGGQGQGAGAQPMMARPGMGQAVGTIATGNIGGGVEQILNNVGLNNQLTHQIGGMINGITASFFAPSPDGPIPPHVHRRVMRFCTRHPSHPKCQGHPEWQIRGQIPDNLQSTVNLNDVFPNLIPIQIPPIPQLAVTNFLAGVPDILKRLVPPDVLGQINEIGRRAIQSLCARTDCLKQKPEFLNQRATIAEHEAAINRVLLPSKPIVQVDRDVETRLARTFQVKKALIQKAGLQGRVEPANNGVYQQDLLLTVEQANALITEINENRVGVGVAGGMGGRLKRAGNSLYLENAPAQRWPVGSPILYMFDRSVTEMDKGSVRGAIAEIQSRSCLRFQETGIKPTTSHLYYIKIANPAFCGLSYVGRIEPANPIYLSFMCGNAKGVAIHETLHAIGLGHEQLRADRDKHITVNWENVNPQNYDFFAASDITKFSSYGVKYDYSSIMHYASTIASQNMGKKTMTAKINPTANDPRMGQRQGMTASDAEVLQKMYCKPTCQDKNVYCGAWATTDQCRTANGAAHGWMVQNCRKSCNFC